MMRSLICGCLILASVGAGDAKDGLACPAGAKDPSCHSPDDKEILLQSRARVEDEDDEEEEQELIEDDASEISKANATHPFGFINGVAYAYDAARCHTVSGAKKMDCGYNGWIRAAGPQSGYTPVDDSEAACKKAFEFLSQNSYEGRDVQWQSHTNQPQGRLMSDYFPKGCYVGGLRWKKSNPRWATENTLWVGFNYGEGQPNARRRKNCPPSGDYGLFGLCINKAAAAAAAEPTCAAHTCTTMGWVKKNGVDDETSPDEATCCEATCAAFTCMTMGWVKKSEVDTLTSPDEDTCCEETCAAFQCQTGWVKKSGVDDLTSPDDSTCCEETCDAYECQQDGWKKKEGVGDQTSPDDATCCEEPGLQYAGGRGETINGQKGYSCNFNGYTSNRMYGYQEVKTEDECRKAAESINWPGARGASDRYPSGHWWSPYGDFSGHFSTLESDWRPHGCTVAGAWTKGSKTKTWDMSKSGGKTNVAYWFTWNSKHPQGNKWHRSLTSSHRVCWKQAGYSWTDRGKPMDIPCDDNNKACPDSTR